MTRNIQDSVVLITSQDDTNNQFGTGFVIHQTQGTTYTYILTCAHVVKAVGGSKKVKVDGEVASVWASGEEWLDLAVLRVEGLPEKTPFDSCIASETDDKLKIIGFQFLAKDGNGKKTYSSKVLHGRLGGSENLQSNDGGDRIIAWTLRIAEEDSLLPGYSGSPVINPVTGKVFAVVSHNRGEQSGLAISIEELKRICKFPTREEMRQMLMRLGYDNQVKLFRKLYFRKSQAFMAFTIYGEEDYGQRWLVYRLIVKHVDKLAAARYIKIHLKNPSRQNNIKSIWREFKKAFGNNQELTPSQIIEKIYNSWKTQHVLIILHGVSIMTLETFEQLIKEFWIPLTEKLQNSKLPIHKYKLLMFLVDDKDKIGGWEFPFTDRIDNSWKPQDLLRASQLSKFSSEDLIDWLEDDIHRELLPTEFTNDNTETIAQMILEKSDNGIPEFTFEEICNYCGYTWSDESADWLKKY
jgi:hypothetical protein